MMTGTLDFLGGTGLFLFGMMVMTDALRGLASRRSRELLARFTTNPWRAALTGAATTALVQSSSATILTAIGFVGAGLLSFPQAIGIVLGANVGTTITGWMVALLGIKLQLGTLALAILPIGALGAILAHGARRQVGLALTGFALIFLGLDVMQQGTALLVPLLGPDWMPGADHLGGRLLLALIGAAFTTVIQSSSAGIAAVLVLLAAGSLDILQAAALVIGMDFGTTIKSLFATLGGSRDMRRTAMAHVGYNLATGLVAFLALPLVPLLVGITADGPTAIVLFHTLFNLSGVVLMLPFATQFARLIERLVPGTSGPLPEPLDRQLLGDVQVAHDTARAAAGAIASEAFREIAALLRGDAAPDQDAAQALTRAIDDLEDFLTRVQLPEDAATRNRHAALLHVVDHLHRMNHRADQHGRPTALKGDRALARPTAVLLAALDRAAARPSDPALARQLGRLHQLVAHRTLRLRRSILLREHVGLVSPQAVFELTDGLRWLERVFFHTERILHYGATAAEPSPDRASVAPRADED